RRDLGLRDGDVEFGFDGEHETHHLDGADAEIGEARIDGQRPRRAGGAHRLAYESQQPLARRQGGYRVRFTHAHGASLFSVIIPWPLRDCSCARSQPRRISANYGKSPPPPAASGPRGPRPGLPSGKRPEAPGPAPVPPAAGTQRSVAAPEG